MSLRSASPITPPSWPLPASHGPWLRATLLWAAGAGAAMSAFLLIRRLGRADVPPLGSSELVLPWMAIVVALVLAHGLWRWTAGRRGSPVAASTWWYHSLVTSAGVMLGLSISFPGMPVAVAVFWSVLGGAELAWWLWSMRRVRRPRNGGDAVTGTDEQARAVSCPTPPGASLTTAEFGEVAEEEELEVLPPSLRQQIMRAVDENGIEVVYGTVRCEFVVGQRQQSVHLAFCPPLERVPELSFEQIEGPAAKIQASLVQTFGASLEVRLSAPSTEPLSLQIQFYACVPSES